MVINAYTLRKKEKSHTNNLTFTLQEEINEIENRKSVEKTSKTKIWFFEKITKIDKPLARPAKRKGENTEIIRNESGDIPTDTTEIQRIIRDYYKQL